jgi:hypothetical protein
MKTWADILFVPKRGLTADEYEDAYYAPAAGQCGESGRCFAVADGATETSFSQEWARLLVNAFGDNRLRPRWLRSDLEVLSSAWRHELPLGLPWYAQEKASRGAYAAFVGLILSPSHRFRSWAVGDTCLFHARRGKLLRAFPLTRADEFSSRPALLSTSISETENLPPVQRVTGRWQTGDEFYLASDALAHWLLRQDEAGQRPWNDLRDLATEELPDFSSWIAGLRHGRGLRNDDVTLVRVSLI